MHTLQHIRLAHFVGALVVVAGLVACGAPEQTPSAARLTKIRVADVPIVTQVPFYVAMDRGYFRDAGYEVELVPARTPADAVALVATSQVELGGFGPDPAVFNAMQRGIDIKMLGSAAVFAGGTRASGLVVRQDLIDSGRYAKSRDLKGMKIAISAAQSQFYVELLLARVGLTAADVEFTTLPTADMVAALTGRAIDAAWEVEPLIGAIQAQGLGTLTGTGSEGLPGGIPWIVFESGTFATTDIAARTGFMRAYLRGMRDFYHAFNLKDGAPQPVIESLAAHSSVRDPAVLQTIAMHTVDPNAALDLTVLDRYQDYYLKTGDQTQRVDLARYVDPAPLAAAVAELGRL